MISIANSFSGALEAFCTLVCRGKLNSLTRRCLQRDEMKLMSTRDQRSVIQTKKSDKKDDFCLTYAKGGKGLPESVPGDVLQIVTLQLSPKSCLLHLVHDPFFSGEKWSIIKGQRRDHWSISTERKIRWETKKTFWGGGWPHCFPLNWIWFIRDERQNLVSLGRCHCNCKSPHDVASLSSSGWTFLIFFLLSRTSN